MESIQFPANIVNFVWGILYSQPKNPSNTSSIIQAWLPELQAGTALVVFICAVAALAVTAQQPYPELPEVFPSRGGKLREPLGLDAKLMVKRLLLPGNEPMVCS